MDSTQRFSGRVENYVRHRPGYPQAVVDLLRERCGLDRSAVVADVGSGTGFLSRLFLENGNRVFGVEPNREMREAGKKFLAGYERFTSVAATAEETTLADGSVDFLAAGQAFHWFDPARTKTEFARIIKPDGWVVLVWNERHKNGTPFLEDYERLLEIHGTDYKEVGHGRRGNADEAREFFYPDAVDVVTFDNEQVFDLEGLKGRLLSSSYVPSEGEPGYAEMSNELGRIFHLHKRKDTVTVEYDTRVYLGRL